MSSRYREPLESDYETYEEYEKALAAYEYMEALRELAADDNS